MAAEPGSERMDGGARLREDGWRSQAQGGWMAEPGSGRMDGGARLREE